MLVLDFGGAVRAADRAARARVPRVLRADRRTTRRSTRSRPATRAGIILSGGPASVYEPGAPALDPGVLELGRPGARHLLRHAGAWRSRSAARWGSTGKAEFGKAPLELDASAACCSRELAREQTLLDEPQRQRDRRRPAGFRVTASTGDAPIAAMEDRERGLYARAVPSRGRAHAARARDMLEQLPLHGCQAPADLDGHAVHRGAGRARSAQQVGDERVICALSGGVDSAVAALLVHKAVGDQLTCVFVDHGLLREDEAEQVVETFGEHLEVPLVHVRRRDRFLSRLAGSHRPGDRSARSSARPSSACSRTRRAQPRATSATWCRARSTPT